MIFVDSNVPMYLVGAEHANKARAVALLESLVAAHERLVTNVEVLQEILHRYVAIRRLEAIEPAWAVLIDIVDEVFPIELADVTLAKRLTLDEPGISARDALHIAVMSRHDVHRVVSFDSGLDRQPDIHRLA